MNRGGLQRQNVVGFIAVADLLENFEEFPIRLQKPTSFQECKIGKTLVG